MLNVSKSFERPGTMILNMMRTMSTKDTLKRAAAHWMKLEFSSSNELTPMPKAADARLSIVKHPNNFCGKLSENLNRILYKPHLAIYLLCAFTKLVKLFDEMVGGDPDEAQHALHLPAGEDRAEGAPHLHVRWKQCD